MILHPFVKLLRFSKKYTVHRSHTKQIYKEIWYQKYSLHRENCNTCIQLIVYMFLPYLLFTWSLTLAQLQSQFCNQTNLQLILQSGKLSGSCFPRQFTGSVDAWLSPKPILIWIFWVSGKIQSLISHNQAWNYLSGLAQWQKLTVRNTV